ncbi:MAG TPA: response regulator [Terriglobales bacterium]|nr:response regulator [Terriglobales bacterium]
MSFRTIIADDEPLARQRIRDLLAEEANFELISESANGAQALKQIQEMQPDLLFLDVQMPRLNGFEVLEALGPDEVPVVIFTTAHDEHAVRAFEVNALDYLLKPFTEGRFRVALARAREELAGSERRQSSRRYSQLLKHVRDSTPGGGRILVRTPERILFLKPDEIDHVEAAGNYVILHAGAERHIVRETTAAMEARLTSSGFMRISRSAIVNLARIREVQPVAPGQYSLLLKSGARLDMTCSLNELQSRLSSF